MSDYKFRDSTPARYGYCGICGVPCLHTSANPFPKHVQAVHEVWAYETYGMHAVRFPARPYVQAWAESLPSPEEAEAILFAV